MDILYVIGTGSRHDNAELRWSLRSLEAYGTNLGRVIVAGYPPDWLSDEVTKVPLADDPSAGYKHVNILNCILEACRTGAVDGEFLYSSDDHFLVKPADLGSYPYFFKRERIRSEDEYAKTNVSLTRYRRSLAETRAVLELNGYEPREWSCHANTHMDSADAAEVERLAAYAKGTMGFALGLEPTCCFMSVRHRRSPVTPVPRRDLKVKCVASGRELLERIAERDTFSISDRVFDNPDFARGMDTWFKDKSKFEK